MSTLAAEQYNAAVFTMVSTLADFVGAPSSLAVLEAAERPVGLGNLAGVEERGAIALAEVRGGRVEARVRYDVRAATPAAAAAAALQLQGEIRAARGTDAMRPFAALEPAGGEPAAREADDAWRQGVEYRVLYEYRYDDPDAASLLVRLPVELRGEHHEDDVLTRDLVRWDAEEALPLRLSGPRTLGVLSLLAHLGGAVPAGAVTIRRTHEGAAGLPFPHATVAALAAAARAGTAEGRHGEVSFPGIQELHDAFAAAGDAVPLALLDGSTAPFRPRVLDALGGVRLDGPGDRLEVAFETPGGFPGGAEAVVYLRAGRGHSA